MADITQIRAKIETADENGAGTDAWVYLGIAGREFCLNSGNGDDFERAAKTCFVLGKEDTSDDGDTFNKVTVSDAEWNDPRTPQLDTEDLDRYPAYIRFVEAGDNPPWCIERVRISVHAGGEKHHFDNLRLEKKAENRRIWLHTRYGERLFLHRVAS
ncbi:hypothetical protein [Streptomyces subrutilus]|uniref:hypothetical protein n=1 Tax=Streptomyces subrutilus TaxID=36818 RepID=UPI003409C410